MKKPTRNATSSKQSKRPTGSRSARKPKRRAISAASSAKRGASSTKRAASAGKRPGKRSSPKARRPASAAARGGGNRWLRFVERHGVVLASARGPVPSVAEAVAGQPIIGSWWAHPKGRAIFAALSELDDSDDVRCFKLVDGKVTFVHRRVWPALARLASDGVIAPARVASIQQEHMPTGEHRNLVTPFPDWVPEDVARAATSLSSDAARAQLGAWL